MIPERTLGFLLVLALSIQQIVGPPAVIKNKHDDEKDHAIKTNEVEVEEMMQDADFEVEYKRYLDEIVKTLETDEAFKKKVEASNVNDINSGKIAQELESVSHDVRSKLDELKRQEVQRLRDLIRKKEELGHGPIHPSEYEHIDHFNLETFEVKDLDNLIKKVSKDMEKINELRKEQFKQYELQKQFKEELKMANMTETEREEYKKHLEQIKKKHANHEKIHHPGSKAQLEEVWEKQDHLENQEFDPKIFFHLHDIDSNGYWDQEEVKALFIKELDKMYQAGLPEDDMKERQEEMERMTEHVFKEMDKNGDSLISFDEYMAETKSKEFNQDEGWETLDKQQIYSQQEYAEYERRRVAEIQSMIDQGMILPEEYPGLHHMNQIHPNQPQYHPNQVPQYHPNQVPPQGYHPNQVPPHPNQVPPHPNQVPQHPNQVPPHPNQVPQHPNQVPPHPNQVPQHPNQVPPHPNQVPQHPNQYQNQVPPHNSQQQYQQHQAYQQNQHPNQVPQQQYHPNPPYQPGSQTNQNNQQQYQNNQQQYQNNQQYQQQPNQNHQQYQQQPNQNNQQPNNNNNQQPNQSNQQYQQPNQNNQQYQPQTSQNNQQQQPNPNSQNQASQHSNPQPPPVSH